MKKTLLLLTLTLILLSCSSKTEPTSFLDVGFGTKYKNVKEKMTNKGYRVHSASATRESIVFYGGDFMGIHADLITMDMANDYTFNQGVAMFHGEVEKIIKSLEDIISKKYRKAPEISPVGHTTRYNWSFPNANIRIGGNERTVILTITSK